MKVKLLVIRMDTDHIIEIYSCNGNCKQLYRGKIGDMKPHMLDYNVDSIQASHTSREDVLEIYVYEDK